MAAPQPCRYFQLGMCKKGTACKYAHIQDPTFKKLPCKNFAKGKCRFGQSCTYSHDQNDIATLRSNPQQSPEGDTTESIFKEWRYSIPKDPRQAKKLGSGMTQFCKQALELVACEIGPAQDVINLLAGEGGMLRIAELLDQPFEQLTDAQLARIFDAQLLPFFKTITHINVSASAILEGRIMTIYNYIFGPGGQRSVQLLQAVTRHLSSLSFTMPDGDASAPTIVVNETSIEAFESSLAVASKVIEVNTTAQVHEGLTPIVETLSVLFNDLPDDLVFPTRNATKHLRRMQQRMGLGTALSLPKPPTANDAAKPQFHLAKEMPGALSEDGPRHDNDKVDIRQISILPTLQEIQSARNEYLPVADPREWHLGGLEGLFDRNFRLLREDTVGQLRDAAKFELERLQKPQAQAAGQKRQGARTFVYNNVFVENITFDPIFGLEFVLGFDQPGHLLGRSKVQRREWWEGSKRLGAEAFLCLLSSDGYVTFFVVSPEQRQMHGKADEFDKRRTRLQKDFNLWSDDSRAFVVARLVRQDDISQVLDLIFNKRDSIVSLVEFPGVLLPAFMPTLQALQRMSENLDVPFANILAPVSTPTNPDRDVDISPPIYASNAGFQFDLSGITANNSRLSLTPKTDTEAVANELQENSTLDPGQAQALVLSLSRSLALIQGPPGTGKSFTGVQLIKCLLENKSAGRLGPILCVTFTNHALDQSLERLIDDGVEQVVRIGGRSKSERLTDVNLREVSRRIDLTKVERTDKWNHKKKVQDEAKELDRLLQRLGQLSAQASIQEHLRLHHPDHHDQLFSGVDAEGFITVNHHTDEIISTWLRERDQIEGPIRAVEELQNVHVDDMSTSERQMLHRSWLIDMRSALENKIMVALGSYNHAKENLDHIRKETDLRALRQANIIGITTSGLARNLDLLRRINIKVLICEEAGEVLEAHLLTALLPSVEHATLIGDQQQLRPHVQNYELSSESRSGGQFSLDISLFERLVRPNDILSQPLPYCTLDVQRRMHPSISQLIRKMQYPHLQDGPNVREYPQVMGMRRRLFWMHHENPENESEDGQQSTSHTNDFECEMAASLVSHLVKQGIYRTEDIAIITPYLGQLRKIRSRLAGSFEILLNDRDIDDLAKEGESESEEDPKLFPLPKTNAAHGTLLQALRIATVDNFQGEEAKVVVVSLVRSNKKNKPGFLRTPNRINVLLSRAQHGMYLLGNANTMQNVEMWAEVYKMLARDDLIGDALELCCPRHKDKPITVQVPGDFLRLAPEAGCDLPCDRQLLCGHSCVSKCHSDLLHRNVYCLKPCTRPKEGCSHNCPLACGDRCYEQCLELVSDINVNLDCGHHKTSLLCYEHQDPSKVVCKTLVPKTVPGCDHTVKLPCHVDVDGEDFRCNAVCSEVLQCGHTCKKACHRCRPRYDGGNITETNHGSCNQPCQRNYSTCNHRCQESCHREEPYPLCNLTCEVRCSHSSCDRKCHEPCVPCAEETCSSNCPHSACKMPCAAPCDFLPCSKRCPKLLACGCQCPSLCGEACPPSEYCQKCGSSEIRSLQADLVMFEIYGDVNLDEDPCIFTDCGHVFTVSSMDGIMDMNKHYHIDEFGVCTGLKTSAEPFSSGELKTCPTCRGSLRSIARYGRIVRRALLDESTKKFIIWSNRTHQELADHLRKEQERLRECIDRAKKPNQTVDISGTIKEQLKAVKSLKSSSRYHRLLRARQAIRDFSAKLVKEEQPYQRVRDLVETVRRQNVMPSIDEFEFSSTELQFREHVQATTLLIQCDGMIISDIIEVHNKTPVSPSKGVVKVQLGSNRNSCEALIAEAQKTSNMRQEAEGHLFWARFAAIEVGTQDATNDEVTTDSLHSVENLKDAAYDHLKDAESICDRLQDNVQSLSDGLLEIRNMLMEGTSNSEMRMVVAAMASEFRGTGHWYRCANGHPFTIGECGMPMQLARCPSCGAGIGGQSHRTTEGVTYANDIEERFGGLNLGN